MDISTACLPMKFLGKLLELSCTQPLHCIMVLELYIGFFNNLLMWQYVFSKQEGIFSVCNGSSFTISFFMLTLGLFYFVIEAGSISAAILHFLKISQEGIRHILTFVCIFTQKCPAMKVMGLAGGRYFSLNDFIFHLLSP
jgi:hypothetical protein